MTRVALALVVVGLLSTSAAAQDQQPAFGVQPLLEGVTTLPHGHYRFALAAGSSAHDAMVVRNFSDRPLDIDVYGADMLQAKGGGEAPAQEGEPQHAVGTWISVSQPRVTVPPRAALTDAFTLSIPVGVTPGEHLGAVVAAATVDRAAGISVQARAALVVEVAVPGVVRPSAALKALEGRQDGGRTYSFAIALANTGNVQLTTQGSVDIADSNGRVVSSLPLSPKDAYAIPSGTLDLQTAAWQFPTGSFTVQAHITTYMDGKRVQEYSSNDLHYSFVDWTPIVIGVAVGVPLLTVAALQVGRRHRRSRRWRRRRQTALRRLGQL